MMVQWLRLFFHCQRPSFDRGQGTISQATWHGKKKKKSLKKKSIKALICQFAFLKEVPQESNGKN